MAQNGSKHTRKQFFGKIFLESWGGVMKIMYHKSISIVSVECSGRLRREFHFSDQSRNFLNRMITGH